MTDLEMVRQSAENLADWLSPDIEAKRPVEFSAGALNTARGQLRRLMAALSRLEAQQAGEPTPPVCPRCHGTRIDPVGERPCSRCAPPVECPRSKALREIMLTTSERDTSEFAEHSLATPCSPCPTCAAERERADSNYASCERIKRKFEAATAERDLLRDQVKKLVEGLRPFGDAHTKCTEHNKYRRDVVNHAAPYEYTNQSHFDRAAALLAEHGKQGRS